MKKGFYPRLALDGIRKNKRMYIPYIITCISMVMMTYILTYLENSDTIKNIKGGDFVQGILAYGKWVVIIFSVIFLFYTNSFLIRRRKKEFGLYNILGMNKKNIGMVVFWESIFNSIISILIGLASGMLFSKLAELGALNILDGKISYKMSISMDGIRITCLTFAIIFILIFLNTLRQIYFSSAINLLKSESVGEKPPRANWVIGILGVILLGVAYYIAVKIEDPVSALMWFFIAVIMVIVATYMIMISSSVIFLKILQKRKSYYYKSNHFISVSSMVYRMKRNGAGLASICILSTMVLVMISSTSSLYIGEEDALQSRYPRELNISAQFHKENYSDENISSLRRDIDSIAKKYEVTPNNVIDYKYATVPGCLIGNTVECDKSKVDNIDYSNVYEFKFMSIDEYNRLCGTNKTLSNGEALLYSFRSKYKENEITFLRSSSYKIKEHLTDFSIDIGSTANIVPTILLVVPDDKAAINDFKIDNDTLSASYSWDYYFDANTTSETEDAMLKEMKEYFSNDYNIYIEGRHIEKARFTSLFGGLFYIGIILSIVFILATVLIIYYKQISEGYEDKSRFEIMQKVGMTKREIRKSINSQILTVFFLPLILSGLHLIFAFPMIEKIIRMFNMNNRSLFACTTVVCFLIFGLFYAVIYKITSNAYYNIVSETKEK